MLKIAVTVLSVLFVSVYGDVSLDERGYLQLTDNQDMLQYDSGAAKESAIDLQRKLLYVVGEGAALLHVVNLNDVDNPTTILTHKYNTVIDGKPLDVEICKAGTVTTVAVSFESTLNQQAVGHVVLYEPVTIGNPQLVPKNPTEPQITVGSHPDNIKFTHDCLKLIVSNEGIPGQINNEFIDPPGTVSVVSTTTTTVTSINFEIVDGEPLRSRLLEQHVRWMLRTEPGSSTINKFSNNIEPEYIAVSPNNAFAYVTLQENNAIAKIDLENNFVSEIFPLGVKEWRYSTMDGSDMDTGIILKKHNISSFYQPDKIAFFEWKSHLYLVTADEGKQFALPLYGYSDFERAKTLHTNGMFQVNEPALDAELADDAQLGRLLVSQRFDGQSGGKIDRVFTFGGRGFSVFNANNLVREWESGDEFEKYNRLFYPTVFNGDCTEGSLTPFGELDTRSTSTGPSLNAIVDGEFKGRKILIFASGTNGLIYIYELENEVSAKPELLFQSVHRRGSVLKAWRNLYADGTIGDAGIEDMSFIPIEESPVTGTPVLVVVSRVSGSVSLYTFAERQFPIGQNGDGSVCKP